MAGDKLDRVRIDKWLWAARFFKTRSLATDAVDGGKVQVNGQRIKPAKEVRVGDEIALSAGDQHWTVIVRELSDKRGPAPVAQALYAETAASLAAREARTERGRIAPEPGAAIHGRPTKKARRQLHRFTGE